MILAAQSLLKDIMDYTVIAALQLVGAVYLVKGIREAGGLFEKKKPPIKVSSQNGSNGKAA